MCCSWYTSFSLTYSICGFINKLKSVLWCTINLHNSCDLMSHPQIFILCLEYLTPFLLPCSRQRWRYGKVERSGWVMYWHFTHCLSKHYEFSQTLARLLYRMAKVRHECVKRSLVYLFYWMMPGMFFLARCSFIKYSLRHHQFPF